MRRIAGAIILIGASFQVSEAQVDLGGVTAAIRAIRDNNLIGEPVQTPLQPTGNPGLPEKVDEVPQEHGFTLIHADTIHTNRDDSVYHVQGNVEFVTRGYRVSCDEAIGNQYSQIFTLRGNIHIDGELLQVVEGKQVTIDFIGQTYEAIDTQAQLSPRLVGGRLRDKLYVKGHDGYGSEKETTTRQGELTTCNYPAPHYEITGDSIIIRPGRRAIFRKTKIIVLGRTLITLPFLSIPLNDRTYKNIPYVGHTPDEGYFVKTRYGIPGKNPDYNWDTREDYMTRLGLGLGTDYTYLSQRSAGMASIYHIFGPSGELDLSNTHKQVFRWGTLQIQNDYEKDNHLVAPDSTSLNTRIAINIPQGTRATDRLTFSDAISSSAGYSTSNDSIDLSDTRNFGPKTQTSFDVSYFGNSSQFGRGGGETSTSTTNETLNVHFQGQEDLTEAQALLEYQRTIPIGTTKSFIGGSDETPVLSLQSDARRLFGNSFGQTFPFKTEVSWGDFQDPRTSSDVTRGYFDFNFNRIDPSKGRFHFDTNGEFRQGIYSDGAAEYALAYGSNVRYDLGQNTGINVRYNYMEPFGYSPLSIDQTGKTDFLSEDLNIRPVKPLLIGAQSGFDFLRMSEGQEAWQPVSLRTEYQPAKWFMFRGLSTYDTTQEKWTSTEFDITYVPGSTRVVGSATYDGTTGQFSSANLFLDNLKIGRTRISTSLAYDGYLKRFDSEQLSAIYDLHCAEAVLVFQENNSGFRAGQQFQFFIRLKAIPYDVPFGVGTRGEPIGFTGAGSPFGNPGGSSFGGPTGSSFGSPSGSSLGGSNLPP